MCVQKALATTLRSSVTVMEIQRYNDKTTRSHGYNKCLQFVVKYMGTSLKKNGDETALPKNTCLPSNEAQKGLSPLKTTLYFSGTDPASVTRFGFKEAIVRLCKK